MDLKFIKRLIRLMDRADLVELEVEEEGKKVRLKRAESHPAPQTVYLPKSGEMSTAAMTASEATASAARTDGGTEFRSPMVGTFYRSPSPEADSFVSKGSKVTADSVLCIIEAMKVMNEIKAEMEGEILDVLVKNGEPVEFGQPLFLIKPR